MPSGAGTSEGSATSAMLDLAFDADGRTLARDHRHALAAALQRALPWLAAAPGAGVHGLKLPPGEEAVAHLSQRTRLMLRLRREHVALAQALDGVTLELDGLPLRLHHPRCRELLPLATQYAHLVAFEADDELAFLGWVDAQLSALGVRARVICGRRQVLECGTLAGYSLMLDGLAPADALRLQEQGVGAHRQLGCGVFVPHKSAAPVGAAP